MKKTSIGLSLLVMLLCGEPGSFVMAANAVPQSTSIEAKGTRLPDIFKKIERQTGAKIIFSYEDVKGFRFTGTIPTGSAEKAVAAAIAIYPLSYRVEGQYIYIDKVKSQAGQELITLTGKVTDTHGEPLPGANVINVGTNSGYGTLGDGTFYIQAVKDQPLSLHVSYLGMKDMTLNFDGKKDVKNIRFVMEEVSNELQDVVVNGMFERKASTFTGSVTTFTKDEVLEVGNQNVIKSLAALDPAFIINEDVSLGSNPNSMPNIQLRGETSFNVQGDYDGNANQPLFIVDGFESTIEKVYDLDMNRIEKITILKDASAKAVYGSKAGNGVVVIQTVRPKSGEMRISYNGSLSVEAPDLTGYNLMNAKEKYDWEVAHHKYDNWQVMQGGAAKADELQKSVYDAIASGVDTYWLNKPLRNGVGHKHNLNLEGGDAKVRYILGLSYNDIEGVMKESNRQTFNINSTLSYSYKNMVFRNQMDFTHNTANNSPYGSFSEYVGLEPYFAPYDSEGKLKQILGYETANENYPVYNPLYNATLNTKDVSKYSTFTDNFDMDWHINEQWRFTAQFSYSHTSNGSDVFYPASHTMFATYDANGMSDRKGQYTQSNGTSDMFTAQAGINYNLVLGKHAFFWNGTWNMQTQQNASNTMVAEGFGNDNMDNIAMATSYQHNASPSGSDSRTREVGFVGALNYSYDDRYLLDGSIRETGSSVYGSDNHWGTFWSAGAGWNIHNEHFWGDTFKKNVTMMKVRYSVGFTGTQNFNPYQARAKYQYGDFAYDGRYGATIMGIPNTGLKWQKVWDSNLGFDFAFRNMLTLRAEYYVTKTDNMLVDITIPASTGFNSYKENMGEMQNTGYELALGYTPWRDSKSRSWISFSATATHYKNEITKIYDIFKQSNDAADEKINTNWNDIRNAKGGQPTVEDLNNFLKQTTRPATKYYEGCSMTAIWGVRSLGIDPQSGQELFLDKEGNVTQYWNSDDQVVIGDTNPKLRGTLSVSGGWNGWTLSLMAQYKFGGDMYNTSLVDRVENVNGFGNLDRRTSETWNEVGQLAKYRLIEMGQSPSELLNQTKPTSRFVQRDNELYFTTINLGYDFFKMKWLTACGVERLKLNFYCNELARWNSIQVERGLSYPFARTFTFSLSATF